MRPVVRVMREDRADTALPLPTYETAGAAGADLRANLPPDVRAEGLLLLPMQRALVPTGLRIEIPEDYEARFAHARGWR